MGSHPLNLAVRFLLEMAALAAFAVWGWTAHDGVWRYVWAVGLVVAAAVLWGTFAVPDDPSRSGSAPVAVPGVVRLLLELAFFALGAWAIAATGRSQLAALFGIVVIIHYAVSYDRVLWLLGR